VAKSDGPKPVSRPPGKPVPSIKLGSEEKKQPVATPRGTKIPPSFDRAPSTKLDKPGAPGKKGKDDDNDDPIALATKYREQFGGPTAVVSAADAKKLGLKVTKVEPKDPKKIEPKGVKPAGADPKNKLEAEKKPAPGIKPTPKGSNTKVPPVGKKAGAEDDDDPIGKSLAERVKAGGVT